MLKIVVIARSFDALEFRLLSKNCTRARRVFRDIQVSYVLGNRKPPGLQGIDTAVSFFLVRNAPHEQNAALSRAIGFRTMDASEEDLVLFLDGDMLITEPFLLFLKALAQGPFIATCSRLDLRCGGHDVSKRYVPFDTSSSGRFRKLYGCLALRGVAFDKYNVMTHDMEEQWFLHEIEGNDARHVSFGKTGVIHFDRFSGMSRLTRILASARGVGFWQGLFRSPSTGQFFRRLLFAISQRDSIGSAAKLLLVSLIAFPKHFIYSVPQSLRFEKIDEEDV